MTRLITEMIDHIPSTMEYYDQDLKKKTGKSLLEIAIITTGAARPLPLQELSSVSAAVVPVTAGRGVISGFSAVVQAILAHLGFQAKVTDSSDVAGLAEALESGTKIVFLADDRKFIAVNTSTGQYAENGEATGRAFVTALNLASGGLAEKKAAVLGLGPVGRAAVNQLLLVGALPVVFDPDPAAVLLFRQRIGDKCNRIETVTSPEEALSASPFIIDACPTPNIISGNFISDHTIIASPGVPHGLTSQALKKLGPSRFIHDPLQLGVAVMALKCVFPELMAKKTLGA